MSSADQANDEIPFDSTGMTAATTAKSLSPAATKEIEGLINSKKLVYIVAYSASGKPEEVILADKIQLSQPDCEPIADAVVPSGYGKCKPLLTCKWVSIGSTLYWVCA